MKKLYILISICCTTIINAQTFSEKININFAFDVQSLEAIATNNSYIIGVTEVQIQNNFHKKISIIKTNIDGTLQNVDNYDTTDGLASITCNKITQLSNGNLLISGIFAQNDVFPFNPFLMAIDANGSVVWAKILNIFCTPEAIYFQHLQDNSLLGIVKNNDTLQFPILFKLDNNGNVVSSIALNSSPNNIVKIITNPTTFDILTTDGNLLNINNELNVINSQTKYNHLSGINFAKTANGDTIIAAAQVFGPGYLTISRINTAGNTLWSKNLQQWEGASQNQLSIFDIVGVHLIKETANGNIFIAANSEGGLGGSFQIVLDANGNHITNYKTTHYKNKMLLLEEDEFLILGTTTQEEYNTSGLIIERRQIQTRFGCDQVLNFSIANEDQIVLPSDNISFSAFSDVTSTNIAVTKTTATLNTVAHCESILSLSENNKSNIKIYPNPATSIVNIETNTPITAIHLMDNMGRILHQGTEKTINIGSLPAGIYYLQIKTNETVTIRKVLKK